MLPRLMAILIELEETRRGGRYVHSCAVLDYGCSVMDLQILNLRALELTARGYSLSEFQDDIQREASSIEKFLCEATGEETV